MFIRCAVAVACLLGSVAGRAAEVLTITAENAATVAPVGELSAQGARVRLDCSSELETDGTSDAGFEPLLGFVDVIEVHPLEEIFTPSAIDGDPRKRTHAVFRWLQMLNLGYRIPGVVNTDAHYAFHGSGWLRNSIASHSEHGHAAGPRNGGRSTR